ncbi:hypothetical protein [Granulicella sp. L60]|jgi:hypothetical protein|uniref:hypothetical protein n=1 Tax=Granulicella sp. L60 TaxID=1641866 RepID=UPI00131C18DB|nr:hypothetical protein [Granulicella sp. L60]
MANQGTHNPPSQEASVKGGQHLHQASQGVNANQSDQGNKGKMGSMGNKNQPNHEASVKGGEHSHSGSSKR